MNGPHPIISRFDFRGVRVQLATEVAELHERITKDFSAFVTDLEPGRGEVRIAARLGALPFYPGAKGKRGRKTRNCVIRDLGSRRLNEYPGGASVIYDFGSDTAEVHATTLHRLHEVVYLLILSRVGKRLDRKGLHRIHAAAVTDGKSALVLTLPMNAGKTTVLLDLLRDPGLRILSDDSPLITQAGEVAGFPLRLGLTPSAYERSRGHPALDHDRSYELVRTRYGRKKLLPVEAIRNGIDSGTFSRVILVHGRGQRQDGAPTLRPTNGPTAWKALFFNMVIGLGLPMMREYFFEGRWADRLVVMRIFFQRVAAARRLLRNSECYEIRLSQDPAENAKALRTLLVRPIRNPEP